MKKIIAAILLAFGPGLHAFSSAINHRLITSSPLLYKQIDYSHDQLSIEFEPWVSGMFNPNHTTEIFTPDSKLSLSLNQQGHGDINPAWMYLGSSNGQHNYTSTISFTPTQQLYGLLFHCYKQFEYVFYDVKTALLQCKNKVTLDEFGGGNGGLSNYVGTVIHNASEAFTQNIFRYGKIGDENQITGFDNLQFMFGASTKVETLDKGEVKSYFAGFAVVEVPTGGGTKSEWLFEPQIGTNHWGLGFGVDLMIVSDSGYSFVFGGNFRHFIANWETRTFDLTENGGWSRYLLVEPLSTIPGPLGSSVPAINILTQDALIEGRNEITMYGRLQKQLSGGLIEVSYNLFYNEAERISRVKGILPGYGIFAIQTGGGISTASTATINEAILPLDLDPVEIVTSDLNLASGAAGQWLSNTVAVRLQRVRDFYTYGIGGSVDLAATEQAISNWSVWVNFEILLP